MYDPHEPRLAFVKQILHYVKGTLDYGLQLHASSASTLTAYFDADWVGCPISRCSTSDHCIYFGDNLVSCSAKRQTTMSNSSPEVKYGVVAHTVAECCWLLQLLQELHHPLYSATVVYYDNISAMYMSSNPVQHHRTKNIEINIHFIHKKVSLGQVRFYMCCPLINLLTS